MLITTRRAYFMLLSYVPRAAFPIRLFINPIKGPYGTRFHRIRRHPLIARFSGLASTTATRFYVAHAAVLAPGAVPYVARTAAPYVARGAVSHVARGARAVSGSPEAFPRHDDQSNLTHRAITVPVVDRLRALGRL